MNVMVDELEDNELEFTLEDGTIVSLPLIAMFNLNNNYYVVVLVSNDEKKELVVMRAININGKDTVKLITDKDEWDKVNEAWSELVDKACEGNHV